MYQGGTTFARVRRLEATSTRTLAVSVRRRGLTMTSPQRAVKEPLRSVSPAPRPAPNPPSTGGWFGRLFGGTAAPPAPVVDETEAFLAFPSERAPAPEQPARPRRPAESAATPAQDWRPFARPLAIVLGLSFAVVLGVL